MQQNEAIARERNNGQDLPVAAACREAIRQFTCLPPDRDKRLARQAVSSFAPVGEYVGPEGRVMVFGPVQVGLDGDTDIDNLFEVKYRYLEGPNAGEIGNVSFFGPTGFLSVFKLVET